MSGKIDYQKLPLQSATEAHQKAEKERTPAFKPKPNKRSMFKGPTFQQKPSTVDQTSVLESG